MARLTTMLYVKDLARMASFYEGLFGVPPTVARPDDGWVEFDVGSSSFALHAVPPHVAELIEISVPPEIREDTPYKVVVEVTDVAGALVRLHADGAIVIERPWGGTDLVDPEGNVVGLIAG